MRKTAAICILFVGITLLSACISAQDQVSDPSPTLADEIIFYDWEGDIPAPLIEDFTAEYGVKVQYLTYESQTEALDNLHLGNEYDVVVFDNSYIPTLISEELISTINYEYVSNIRNISANFRDLVYDPGNKHSIPFNWGTTGLLIKGDIVGNEIATWSDLWSINTPNKILLWKSSHREIIGLTLKSLGYSANSEDPAELKQAEEKLMALRSRVVFVNDLDDEAFSAVEFMDSPLYPVALGWAYDAVLGREQDPPITYILPAEGTILWGDNFVIPTSSKHQATAELFLNYLLRPEVSAQITNQNLYANANNAAREYINADILTDPFIYPDTNELLHAEIILPLNAEGEELMLKIWDDFVSQQP